MGRPVKERCINCVPVASYYKPVGIPMRDLDEIVLAMDELEAMRLTDLEGMYQADAAERDTGRGMRAQFVPGVVLDQVDLFHQAAPEICGNCLSR